MYLGTVSLLNLGSTVERKVRKKVLHRRPLPKLGYRATHFGAGPRQVQLSPPKQVAR